MSFAFEHFSYAFCMFTEVTSFKTMRVTGLFTGEGLPARAWLH